MSRWLLNNIPKFVNEQIPNAKEKKAKFDKVNLSLDSSMSKTISLRSAKKVNKKKLDEVPISKFEFELIRN